MTMAIVWWLPIPDQLQKSPIGTLTLLDCRGREIAEIASPEARAQLPRKLDELGKWLPRVTVALEDHRFYEHAGVDWRATASACTRNLKAHRIVSGASTITQQLVKMASGRQRRSWLGKFYETIVAWKIERRWSKERILTEYLNRSSYGNRRLGPEAAARAYFGKSACDLTLAESIFLAGLPQAPTRFNPWRHPSLSADDRARPFRSAEFCNTSVQPGGSERGHQRNAGRGVGPHDDPLLMASPRSVSDGVLIIS